MVDPILPRVHVLGAVRVVDGFGRPIPLPSVAQRRFVAAIAISPDRSPRREFLADVLGVSEGAIRTTVSRLRKLIGAGTLTTDGAGYRLKATVDAVEFSAAVASLPSPTPDNRRARVELLDDALSLWGGDAVEEFRDEAWAIVEVGRLEELRAFAIDDRAQALIALGRVGEAVASMETQVGRFPLRDRSRAILMTALAADGRQAEALRAYQQYRAFLIEEVGTEPSAEVQRLERHIAAGGSVAEAPPAMPNSGRATRPKVPVPLTELLGRARELDEVSDLLGRARLVTITGYGGVGKTRLAAEIAGVVSARFFDGVWWVELGPVSDPEAVVPTIASAIVDIAEMGRDQLEAIASAYSHREALIVLDNCEHLVVEVRRVVLLILERCPGVRVLATSQVSLAVPGERLLSLDPLPVRSPSLDELAPAVRLFSERAQAGGAFALSTTNLADVEALCQQLDGLPLAIELAASRARSMRPREILARLDERFQLLGSDRVGDRDRHRSLQRTLEWSYGLLDEAHRTTFECLSVFGGSFTIEAAEGVCRDDGANGRTAAHVATLVDHSMLSVTRAAVDEEAEVRYQLAESFKLFGRGRLEERAGTAAARRRHALHFVSFAERARDGVRGVEESRWRRAVDTELANLRDAHATLVSQGDVDGALRLVCSLYEYAFFALRGEIGTWATAAVAMDGAPDHPRWADATAVAALLAWARGSAAETTVHLDALDGADEYKSPSGNYLVEFARGLIFGFRGRMDLQCDHFELCRDIADLDGDRYRQAVVSGQLAFARSFVGRDDAVEVGRQAVVWGEELGNPTALCVATWGLGTALVGTQPAVALRCFAQAAQLAREVGSPLNEGAAESSAIAVRDPTATPAEELSALLTRWEYWHRVDYSAVHWFVFRRIAFALLRVGAYPPVAVMLGAEEAAQLRFARSSGDERRIEKAFATLRLELGEADLSALGRTGAAMDQKDLGRYVVEAVQREIAALHRAGV